MRFCKMHDFGSGIKGIQLGWSAAGPPLMMVHYYILEDIMVDSGQSHMRKEVVDIALSYGIKKILLTHHHEDHSGNAAAVADVTGAGCFGHDISAEKLAKPYRILPYQKYVWGRTTPLAVRPLPELFHTSAGTILPVYTPGHSKDHTIYFIPEAGVIFSGDLYLGDRIKFFRSDEDLGSQIDSLQKVVSLDFDTLLCGHNPRKRDGKNHILAKLQFLEDLYGNTVDLWEKGIPEKQIFSSLNLKESYFIKYFCFCNVSMINGVRSIIRHYQLTHT